MQLTRAFWIASVVMVILLILPTVLTITAPAYDGTLLVGFPLPFYTLGGLCETGTCTSFFWYFLLLDVVVLVGVPFLINAVALKFGERAKQNI